MAGLPPLLGGVNTITPVMKPMTLLARKEGVKELCPQSWNDEHAQKPAAGMAAAA